MKIFIWLFLPLLLTSCSVGREYKQPSNDAFWSTKLADGLNFSDLEPVEAWWETLNDPQLASLVQSALQDNLEIEIAMERVRQSRAELRETGLDRIPTVDTSAEYSRQRLSNEGIGGPRRQRTVSLYDGGFDAFWESDLFGRVSNRIDQARALREQSLADLRAAYVTVAAEVARNYVELRGAQLRLDIARRNEANQKKTFELTQEMMDGGRSTKLDVSRAQTQLALTQSTIPTFEAQVQSFIRRLSVLTGQVPDALNQELQEIKPLPSVPTTLSIGNVQSLLRRRPDIYRAEQAIAQAVAEYNLAFVELFPDVSLKGAFGFAATSFVDWFSAGALDASVGPTIEWKILDFQRTLARMDQADAETKIKLKEYELTVLESLEEVQNGFTDFSKEEIRRQSLFEAAKSSAQASQLARQRFEAGLDDFLDILDAERTQLDAEDTLAESETSAALRLIAIYKALGGGWQFQSS